MTNAINLSIQGANLHLESSPSLTFHEFLASLRSFVQSSPNTYTFSESSEAGKKLSLKVPPGIYLDVSMKNGILSIGSLQGSHQMSVLNGELILLGFRGSLELELGSSRALLLNAEGVLRARLSETVLEYRAGFQESWLHMIDSQMTFFHDGKLEGKLEIQGRGSEIHIDRDHNESLMIQAEANEFHHFGSNGKFFITSLGGQKYFGFLEGSAQKNVTASESGDHNLLQAEEILRESEDLINLFDQYENQIESMFEDAELLSKTEDSKEPQKIQTERERYLLALAKEGKVSLEDLEKLLVDENE